MALSRNTVKIIRVSIALSRNTVKIIRVSMALLIYTYRLRLVMPC